EKGTGESAVAAVILRQFGAEQKILNQGENPVRDIFPPGHPAAQRAPAEDARGKDAGEKTAPDEHRHRGDERRSVLVVGVDHDHDVRAGGEGESVTGLLITAVAAVLT